MSRATAAPAAGISASERSTARQRIVADAVTAASWLACHLPERPLVGLAELIGELWYLVDRRRAEQARRNLRRVTGWMVAEGLADARIRAASRGGRALDRLVRAAFRHYATYYLDVARAPALTPAYLAERLTIETPDSFDDAFGEPGPRIFVGLHFGAIELQAYVAAVHAARPLTTPMETVDDPALQRYFVRTRGALGIRIVGLREARREVLAALGRGEPVGIVGDRDLTGGGMPVTLFGSRTSLPLGPALVAIESGAPTFAVTARRLPGGRYVGRLDRLAIPAAGSRRERVSAFLDEEARWFERQVSAAPEQWWAVFFPIWPDLEADAAGGRR